MTDSDHWLELSEAAQILKLHPSTLRRWSDAGKIAHIRTLSGRRRFDPAVIEQVREEIEQPSAGLHPSSEPVEFANLTPNQVHASVLSNMNEDWLQRLTDEQKLIFRYSGQRLLELLIQYMGRDDDNQADLHSARQIASDYGVILFKVGLSLSQAIEAFLTFRRSFLELETVSPGGTGRHDLEKRRLFLKASDFFDALLIDTLNSYLKVSQPDTGHSTL